MAKRLGMLRDGVALNNACMLVLNFFVIFGTQLIFEINDLLNAPNVYPTIWQIVKSIFGSMTATLIFYGYNKQKQKENE